MSTTSGPWAMTSSDDDYLTTRAALATSEERKGDDDDYLNGMSFERGLVRVGQHQDGLPEHPDELSDGCAGPPAQKSNLTNRPLCMTRCGFGMFHFGAHATCTWSHPLLPARCPYSSCRCR